MEPAHRALETQGLHEGDRSLLGPSLRFTSGKKSGNNLIYKFFNRQPNKSLIQEADASNEEEPDGTRDFIITPCPYIRPLQNKLLPRTEVSSRSIRYQRSDPIISARYADEQLSQNTPYGGAISHAEQPPEKAATIISNEANIQLRSATLCKDIAAAAAYDPFYIRAWNYYVKCYSEGRFNIISPPDPPPMKPSFSFLPAVNPTHEAERLVAFENCNTEWNDWTCIRARDLVFDALLKFDAPWAAISFFNHDSELIMAELGYNRQTIPRCESIAAHVLFSTDPMVIPDLQKDWRFAGNPMVCDQRKIRFFAGVPLLSEDGHVIGVFAIFGPNPRNKFTVTQRHDLFEFGIIATRDLVVMPRQATIDDKRRETPILQREDLINGTSNSSEFPLAHPLGQAKSPISPISPMRCGRQNAKTNKRSRERVSFSSEPTPPTSDDSDSASVVPSQRSATTAQHVPIDAEVHDSGNGEEDAMRSLTYSSVSPRPFSSSDLTSVEDMARFCTPEPSSEIYDSISPPRAASMADVKVSMDSSVFSKQHQGSSDPRYSNSHDSGQGIPPTPIFVDRDEARQKENFTIESLSLEEISHIESLNGPKPVSHRKKRGSMSSISTNMTASDAESINSRVEAEFAAAFWAQNLGFDTIYAVEIFPFRPFMTDEELKAPGGMGSRLTVCYGLGNDVSFTMSMHLQALRTAGGVIWDDDGSCPGEYRRGFMMTLAHDKSVLQNRSRGLVFGAFRKTPKDGSPAAIITVNDIKRLREFAIVLKRILLKSLKDRQRRCQTEPSSPSGIPADEPMEIGKHSLDVGMERMEDLTQAVLIRSI